MAHREQHGNKEKKKPKQDRNKKDKGSPPPFVQPELVRKPHKGKPEQGLRTAAPRFCEREV